MPRPSTRSAAAAVILAAAAAMYVPAHASIAPLSLRIDNESAPPGALVQMKLSVTEPKPISSAKANFDMPFSEIAGIALGAAERTALAVATVHGSRVTMAILSPGANIASDSDYPVLTIVGRVPATAPYGAQLALSVDPASLAFTDPSGAVYPTSLRDGTLSVEDHVGIENVLPGSGDVVPGDRVTVVGRRFSKTTKLKVKDTLLSGFVIVDSSHAVVTFAQPATLHGHEFLAINPGNDEVEYFSYQRTAPQGTSAAPALQAAMPVFPDVEVIGATVEAGDGITGLALQNRHATVVVADCVLVNAGGEPIAAASVAVEPGRYVLRELSELFGVAYSTSNSVRVSAQTPLQVMGVAVDAAGAATPIPAR